MLSITLDFRRAPRGGWVALALLSLSVCAAPGPAATQSAPGSCASLQAEIARAGRPGNPRGAARAQAELNRAAASAAAQGCNRQQFLFFGDPPPPQCAGLNAKIAQLRASVAAASGGDEGRKQALIARFNAECRARPAEPRNFLEDLFGVQQPAAPMRQALPPEPEPDDGAIIEEDGAGRARGGSQAVCVRGCDGGFFPLNFSARSDNLDSLNQLCKALCPNADATLYTKPPGADIETALSIDGEAYSNHPNALRFAKSYDKSCGCKPPGKSWSEALEDAERILAETNSRDTVVTAEQAEQLSRPVAPAALRGVGRKPQAGTPPGASDPAQTATPSGPETYREVVGPDGVKKRVRVVAPQL